MAVEPDNVLVSVAIESISVGGCGSVIERRFALSADKVSADEITAGDPVTPELIAVGACESEEVAVCSTEKEGKLVRDTNSIRGGRLKCHSKVRGDGSQGPSTSSTREDISSSQHSLQKLH